MSNITTVTVKHWDESHPIGSTYLMEVDDQRNDGGQLFVQVSTSAKETLVGLGVILEINSDDDNDIPATPCLHLQHNGESVAAIFYTKRGLLLRREDGTPGLMLFPTMSAVGQDEEPPQAASRTETTYFCPRGCQTFTTTSDPGECGGCGSRFQASDDDYNAALQAQEDIAIARAATTESQQ